MNKILSILVIAIVAVTIYAFCQIPTNNYQTFDNGIKAMQAKEASAKASLEFTNKIDSLKQTLPCTQP